MRVLRIRYSIRGLAVLTAVVAAGLAWYVTKVTPQERAVDCILAEGGWVAYGDFEIRSDALQHIVRRDNHNVWRGFFAAPTVVSLGGDDVDGDALCAQLARLASLREAYLDRMGISDAGLENLAGLQRLRDLSLRGSKITDAGLHHLPDLSHLEYLDLSETGVSDAGLAELAKLRSLKQLSLVDTGVTA